MRKGPFALLLYKTQYFETAEASDMCVYLLLSFLIDGPYRIIRCMSQMPLLWRRVMVVVEEEVVVVDMVVEV